MDMPTDTKENTIRARVRRSEDFEPGSLRTIAIDETNGISQVIGKLKGATTTTGQSLIFDKRVKNWTQALVEGWLRDHGLEVV